LSPGIFWSTPAVSFVQIGEENVHAVRALLDEVFGRDQACGLIAVKKTGGQTTNLLPPVCDYLLWYARNRDVVKYRPQFKIMTAGEGHSTGERYDQVLLQTGEVIPAGDHEDHMLGARFFRAVTLSSNRPAKEHERHAIEFRGRSFTPPANRTWTTTPDGIARLVLSERVHAGHESLNYLKFLNDFPANPIGNLWDDLSGSPDKIYVVQTNPRVIQRCMLMTTDPGDLVLDPTCGSGTTGFVAEQWGRRWITVDTSRVAVAISRQRLLTAKYEYYKLKIEPKGVAGGFQYKTVGRTTLKSIAQNPNLDPIFAKHGPILDAKLVAANTAVRFVPDKLRHDLKTKLLLKQKHEGKRSITDGDRRRWDLPEQGKSWVHWDVPFDTDPDYPADLKAAVEEYRAAWQVKMDEVNACIEANAEPVDLLDEPGKDNKITRVSGPFTVEAVQPPEMSLSDATIVETGFAGEPDELSGSFAVRHVKMGESAQNLEAYLSKMVDLLRMDGVRFPDNKQKRFTRLDPIYAIGRSAGIHAEGRWVNVGETDGDPEGGATVGVVFGPQYGPITAKMIEEVIRPAARRYDDLVFAGFSFDGAAQAAIDEGHPKMHIHIAHIRPDVNPGMNGLLKEQPGSQLFTVFGRPRTTVKGPDGDGMYTVEMEGVDVYDPVNNTIVDTGAAKVAAWFVDGDYDGRTFCITQAFFPDRSAWDKLSKALAGVVDPERFELFSGSISLPFPVRKHKCVAVKVIDPRGNEVMRVHALDGALAGDER
jgi:adenine-specific DNA-methyltransferase